MKKGKEESNKKVASGTHKRKSFHTDERIKFVFGIILTGFAVYLLFAIIAYLIWWKADQSIPPSQTFSGSDVQVRNWSGKSGAWFADLIVGNGFGLGAFFIPLLIASIGLYLLNFPKIRVWKLIFRFTFATIILSLCLAYIFGQADGFLGKSGPGGAHGYLATRWLNGFMGKLGTGILLTCITITYLVFALNISPSAFGKLVPASLKKRGEEHDESFTGEQAVTKGSGADAGGEDKQEENSDNIRDSFRVIDTTDRTHEGTEKDGGHEIPRGGSIIRDFEHDDLVDTKPGSSIPIKITKPEADDRLSEQEVETIMENYDPRLDLPRYKFPPVSILKEHRTASAFDNAEVIENKENIIKTLGDHKIPIRHIHATVGPTVTLYEIVPERGVRLARIKSLENDIALNLFCIGHQDHSSDTRERHSRD